MKNLTELRARRLIIHKTDTEEDLNNFRPSELETEMDPKIRKYFEDHLQGTLKTSATQSSRFVDANNDVPAQLCRRMIESEDEFLEGSKNLAKKYLAVISAMSQGKQQISRGSLAFVQCEGTEDLGMSGKKLHRFLAVMKLDLGEAFTSIFEEDKKRMRLELQQEAVPTSKEGLQKCALILAERWGDPEHGYDMMMLDRQNRSIGGSDFWHKSFLSGTPALNEDQKWQIFNKETGIILTNLKDHGMISPEEHRALMEQRYDVLDTSEADALEWARTRKMSEENKERLEQGLMKKLDSPVFTPPSDAKEKNFLVYSGQGKMSFKIPKGLEHLLTYEKGHDQAGNEIYRVTFETTKWDLQ